MNLLKVTSVISGLVLGFANLSTYAETPGSTSSQADIQFSRITVGSTTIDLGGSCQGGMYVKRELFTLGTERRNSNHGTFLSKMTLPAPGLRVVIRNVTPGMNLDAIPYTDRAYSGLRSQQFIVQRGTTHNSQYLAVIPGNNTFSYTIQRNEEVLETGSFSTQIDASSLPVPFTTAELFSPSGLLDSAQDMCPIQQVPERQLLEKIHPPLIDVPAIPSFNNPPVPELYK